MAAIAIEFYGQRRCWRGEPELGSKGRALRGSVRFCAFA